MTTQYGTSPARSKVVDVIRGFSLLGILMANMLIFQYGIFGKDELHLYEPSFLDRISHDMLKIFVEGSFMPIFTFIFGYGLIKMKQHLTAKGLKFKRTLVRRSLLLIILGFLHSFFLWEGDILLFYGGISFFLLLFVNRRVKTLLIWAGLFLLLSLAITYGPEAASSQETRHMEQYVLDTMNVFSSGSFLDIMDHRMHADPLGLPGWVMIVVVLASPFMLAPMFLFGMAAAKRGRFQSPGREKRLYLRAALVMVPIGFTAKSAGVLLGPAHDWSSMLFSAGGQVLALGYLYALAVMYAYSSKRSLLIRSFEAVGRMSLTQYLLQTVICIFIFYGFGLGLFGKLGVLPGVLLTLVIYALQAALSLWTLKRFRCGPLEKLLRIFTYWSWSGRPGSPNMKSPSSRGIMDRIAHPPGQGAGQE
ncbi:DUF418 domain-containing protein [Paenibacillus lemnae]|uniref:DUF418 domain-containing protein n=1 Tax=Paenibacillus lemnae TaxID=1330551 RepID=A0A848M115_PAELE|nr:DUF418 domain-containing protein [Paenibacillus lemnae]NMO94455.1 DUF418 domain-containing protein [Paenibacillus lemnae]